MASSITQRRVLGVGAGVRGARDRYWIRGIVVLSVIVTMIAILIVSALVGTYVAFPHRGKETPVAQWLGEALNSASAALPILTEHDQVGTRR